MTIATDTAEKCKTKIYSREKAIKESTEYFKGNKLAAEVFVSKYALKNRQLELVESNPSQMHERLISEFYKTEKKFPNPMLKEEIAELINGFKYLIPGGSPMSGIGNTFRKTSLSNCFVIDTVDSYGGICRTDERIAQISKRRGGAGLDVSPIRPKGLPTRNSALTTDGISVFMERFSNTSREVAQCIAKGQRVLTKRGLQFIEDIKINDKVWTKEGWVKVVNKFNNGKKKIFKTTTKSGYSIKTSGQHVFATSIDKNGEIEENKLCDLKIGDNIILLCGTDRIEVNNKNSLIIDKSYKNINNKPNNCIIPNTIDEKLAYVLGYSYGDGGVVDNNEKGEPSGLTLACSDDWVDIKVKLHTYIKDVFQYDSKFRKGCGALERLSINNKCVTTFLKQNQLLKEKTKDIKFPDKITNSSLAVIYSFISGYFDADGYASGRKKGYVFNSINVNFLKQIQTILLSVGILSKIHREKRKNKKWNDLFSLAVVGCHSKKMFIEFMKESIKVQNLKSIGKRDNWLTPYTCKSANVKSKKYIYCPDASQYLSINTFNRLKQEGENLSEILIQDSIIDIEDVGYSNTYDLKLETEHLFWCEGFYVHNSGRRGALMTTISVHHPEILNFIKIKRDLTKITGANISVRVSDEFMDAVIKNKRYELRWPVDAEEPVTKTKIKAKEVWDELVKSNYLSGEPGILFWDNIIKNSPADSYDDKGFKTVSTNPSLKGDTLVLTDKGIYPIKWLAEKLPQCKVLNIKNEWHDCDVFKSGINKPLFKITFTNKQSVYCTKKHKWPILNTFGNIINLQTGKILKRKTTELKKQDKIYFLQEHVKLFKNLKRKEYVNDRDYLTIESIKKTNLKEDVYDITVHDDTHTFLTEVGITGNCGELPLPSTGSCLLMSMNLSSYIDNPFTDKAIFNWKKFKDHVRKCQRLMDDLVEMEIEAIKGIINKVKNDPESDLVKANELDLWKEILSTCKKGRRTGLGITALGDCIAMLNIKYGSQESIDTVEKIYCTLRNEAYKSSIQMAKERGAFPVFNHDKEKHNNYLLRLPAVIRLEMKKEGRRNIGCLTTPPAGSGSTVAAIGDLYGTTSGFEPAFKVEYKRKRKLNDGEEPDYTDEMGDHWKEYIITHSGLQIFKDVTKKEFKDSPYFGAQAEEIDFLKKVEMQAVATQYVDHAISSTINLPEDISIKTVSQIYITAWQKGCKGLTIYRAGSRDGVLTSVNSTRNTRNCEDCDEASRDLVRLIKQGQRPSNVIIASAPKRSDVVKCDIHRSKVDKGDWLFFVGKFNGHPYEVFGGDSEEFTIPHKYKNGWIIKNGKSDGISQYNLVLGSLDDENEKLEFKSIARHFNNYQYGAFTRLTSLAMRHGTPIKYICEQITKRGVEGELFSFQRAMARILKKYIAEGEKSEVECPQCHSTEMFYRNGCPTCQVCGNSACA